MQSCCFDGGESESGGGERVTWQKEVGWHEMDPVTCVSMLSFQVPLRHLNKANAISAISTLLQQQR